jgi:hypothetical protein
MGRYEDLMAANQEFASLIKTHVRDSTESSTVDSETENEDEIGGKEKKKETYTVSSCLLFVSVLVDLAFHKRAKTSKSAKKESKLMTVEEREQGSVSWEVYWQYTIALGNIHVWKCVGCFALIIVESH